jgi:photosystem II stability/assembly factor-like uncharacterized protein
MGDRVTSVLVGTPTGIRRLDSGRELVGEPVTAMAGEWALTGERVLWHGGDRVAELDGPGATCLLPTDHGVLVGTAGAHLLQVDDGMVEQVVSFDEAEGRAGWYTPWGGPPDVRSLAEDSEGALYVNVHVGGIVRSADGGRTWRPTIDIDSDVHQVVAADGSVLAATAYGLACSQDGGGEWSFLTDGLHATYSRAVAVAGGSVLVSVSRGPDGDDAAVYRLAGDRFERCRDGLPEWFTGNVDTGCLVAGGETVVLGTGDGSVFVSTDAGRRWEQAATGFGAVSCLTIV